MALSDFGRRMRLWVEQCTDEVVDVVPKWTDSQRRDAEKVLTVHLLNAHGQGLRDAARMIRLDDALPAPLRHKLADQIDQAILNRREWL